ncbi:MAG: hypothetical protein NDI84_17680, partial [Steroidobacteraceae bacterium]|nr:hypothetical protein [Steroidobacteraceae bacterium]
EVLNLPVLRDQDDQLGVYVAVRGVLGGWNGAEIQLSTDDGATVYSRTQKTEPSVIGYTTTDLAAWLSGEYPTEQSVTVYLPQAPESISYEALLRYGNLAAIGDEVIQYQTVVDNGDDTYTLSGLVRGRYATDPIAHPSATRFVLIDASVTFVQAQTWMFGQTLSIRAVSLGTSADGVAWGSFDFSTAASQTEWPVHMVAAERDAGTDDVNVTWIGRARLGTETAPRHSQHFAGYRVAWDDGSTVTTADTTDSTYTIPAAVDPIDVTVTPLNSITGEGPASEALTV